MYNSLVLTCGQVILKRETCQERERARESMTESYMSAGYLRGGWCLNLH